MTQTEIYQDIRERTAGALYLGVIGPVRSGKSTFIKKFMESMVLPNITDNNIKERAVDELPQSSGGKTIMTTEPKFVPETAVRVNLSDATGVDVRLIDCVGYIVPSAIGYIENNAPRMVKTPWYDEEIPFNLAAEIGTKKVISEHSSIGIVVTTDGSITDIPRHEYAEAEKRVIDELKELHKPFVVVLNSTNPENEACANLCCEMEEQYQVPVCAVNCLELDEGMISNILCKVLFEFPMQQIDIHLPKWLTSLNKTHPIRKAVMDSIKHHAIQAKKLGSIHHFADEICRCEFVEHTVVDGVCPGEGKACVKVQIAHDLFYQILSEVTGVDIHDDSMLMENMKELSEIRGTYNKFREALDEVERTGYGIVMPTVDEMELDEPEIIKQNGRYGIRLRAQAPSVHLMKATIETEVAPIVGSERQSEELVNYLMREFEENPGKIWDSNIFGTSLYGLVNEGLHNKLSRMPMDARLRMKETVERIVNEGCNGLICIIV